MFVLVTTPQKDSRSIREGFGPCAPFFKEKEKKKEKKKRKKKEKKKSKSSHKRMK